MGGVMATNITSGTAAGVTGRTASGGAPVGLAGVSRSFGTVRALNGLSLEIAPGELVALLGPSGCGKTTALRILAGFERADSGTVTMDGKDVASVPAAKRDMGMVFQSYSLFPNMSAAENVGFGLRMRKMGLAGRRRRAAELLDLVGLAAQARQFPHQLSGASCSGSPWPGRSRSSHGCCCSTSRCPPSTPRSACSCGSRSAHFSSGWASPPCSSPTTRRRRSRWPTGWG
jgi:hypothetical protein